MIINDGYVGTYLGHEVYYLDAEYYFEHKIEADALDYFWYLTGTCNNVSPLVHRGVIIAEASGTAVKTLPVRVNAYDYWMFANMKNRKQEPKQEQKPKQEPKQQQKKDGPNGVRTITERHTVEWYMQHTIDVLNKGVEYGEQKLREVYKRKRV